MKCNIVTLIVSKKMVGATGIEPVTPTMSIVVDLYAKVELREICS